MSWHTPERKIEQALKTYLQTVAGSEFNGVQFVTRFSDLILTEPRIEIICETCDPWPDVQPMERDTGNWQCEITITVYSHYERAVDAVAHDEICGQVADKIINNALVEELAATQYDEDITIFDAWRGTRTNSIDEHTHKTEQTLTVLIAPSQL